jgi:hypothetical protein
MKIKYRKAATLTLDNGHEVDVDYLGKGMFCTAWRAGDDVFLLVKRTREGTDYSKDILISAREDLSREEDKIKWSGRHYLPKIEEAGELENSDTRVFRSVYYEPLRASFKEAYRQFKLLKEIHRDVWGQHMLPNIHGRRNCTGYDFNWHFLSEIEDKVPGEVYEALRAVAEASANYGSDYVFEIEKVNVGVDGFGKLILRDVIFDLELLDKIRRNALERSRRRYY